MSLACLILGIISLVLSGMMPVEAAIAGVIAIVLWVLFRRKKPEERTRKKENQARIGLLGAFFGVTSSVMYIVMFLSGFGAQ